MSLQSGRFLGLDFNDSIFLIFSTVGGGFLNSGGGGNLGGIGGGMGGGTGLSKPVERKKIPN